MVTLNHAVAVAMVHGPAAGLALLETLDADARLAGHHRLDAVRAHLLEMAGDHARRDRALPGGGRADDEHAGTELPPDARRSDCEGAPVERVQWRFLVLGSWFLVRPLAGRGHG